MRNQQLEFLFWFKVAAVCFAISALFSLVAAVCELWGLLQ